MTSLTNVSVWTSMRFKQADCKVVCLSQSNPWYQIRLGEQWIACSCPGVWGHWWMKIDQVPFQPRKPVVSWAAPKAVCLVDQGRWLCPSTLPLCYLQLWAPQHRKNVDLSKRVKRKTTEIPESCNPSYEIRLRQLGLFSWRCRETL